MTSGVPNPLAAVPVLPGETLAGKYRVERVLGKGGMGIVVSARHLELQQRVAIKFLLRDGDAGSIERFMREARAAAQVHSEHVCRVHDVGRLETGEPYIVMEYLEGSDLGRCLAQERAVSVATAAGWVIEACAALAEAHAIGIVHRDLKPANLFLAERGDGSKVVKVLDFGISKLPNLSDMTATQTMVGSPIYMSPEQMESSRSVDQRADVWSLGVILHELIAGAPPFSAPSMIQLSVKVREDAAPSLSSLVSEVPADFDAVVAKCLAKKPDDRYGNAVELAAALAPFATADGSHLANRLIRARTSRAPTVDGQKAPVSKAASTVDTRSRDEKVAEGASAVAMNETVRASTPNSSPAESPATPTPLPGQVTFAPLNTTQERVAPSSPKGGGRRWAFGLAAGVGMLALASIALRDRAPSPTPDAASMTASTTSASTSAPPVASEVASTLVPLEAAVPPTVSAVTKTPAPATKGEEAVRRPTPITPVPRSVTSTVDATSPSAATAATTTSASAPSAEPSKAAPPPTAPKTRALDRGDLF